MLDQIVPGTPEQPGNVPLLLNNPGNVPLLLINPVNVPLLLNNPSIPAGAVHTASSVPASPELVALVGQDSPFPRDHCTEGDLQPLGTAIPHRDSQHRDSLAQPSLPVAQGC